MKSNMGTIDKGLRVMAAVVIAVLYATNIISGAIASVLGAFAVVFIATSLLGICPLYLPFGFSTKVKEF